MNFSKPVSILAAAVLAGFVAYLAFSTGGREAGADDGAAAPGDRSGRAEWSPAAESGTADPAQWDTVSTLASANPSQSQSTPAARIAPDASATVDAIIGFYRSDPERPIDRTALDFVGRAKEGDRVSLALPGFDLEGVVDSVKRTGRSDAVGISLERNIGRAVVQINADGRLFGHVFFNGREHAFKLSGQGPGEWTVTATGRRMIVCEPEAEAAGFPAEGAVRALDAELPAGFSPIALQSLPGAEYVLYIDFDGETLTTPFWNGGNVINAAPHPQAANNSWVTAVWQRVAEDFAPFQLNVTTDRDVFDNADEDKRVMCIATPSQAWYKTNPDDPDIGGVAKLDSFGMDVVCWAFNDTEYSCADTVSHEVGHTFGLVHDGQDSDTDQYFDGHGDGPTSWGAIMGSPFVGYYEHVTQWSMGEYDGAVNWIFDFVEGDYVSVPNTQDDLEVIAGNGFGYRADDAADTADSASGLSLDGTLIVQEGRIERNTDVDFYRIVSEGGFANFEVGTLDVESVEGEPGSDTAGANLAVAITLYDELGNEVASDNPDDRLGASISEVLDEGVYFLSVAPAGRGNPGTNGFSTYGSLGRYFVSGVVPAGPLAVFGGPAGSLFIANGDPSPSSEDGTDFGYSHLGQSEPWSATFTLVNSDESPITVMGVDLDSPEFYTQSAFPIEIPAGGSVGIPVYFLAGTVGVIEETLRIRYETSEPEQNEYSFTLGAVVTKTANDDNYEMNDTFFSAFFLPEETDLSSILGYARQRNNDWYEFEVEPGLHEINVLCRIVEPMGGVSMALYDPRGFPVATLEGISSEGALRHVGNPEGGTYRLRVYGDNLGQMYDLLWEGLAPLIPEPGEEDAYERNNRYGDATDLTAWRGRFLSELNGEGTQFDDDWFKIRVAEGDNLLDVNIVLTGSSGTAGVELRDDKGRFVASSAAGFLSYDVSSGSRTWYLRVTGDGGGQTYDLFYDSSFEFVSPPDTDDDNYERNNTFFEPYDMGGNEGVDLLAIDGYGRQFDPDWYRVSTDPEDNAILFTLEPTMVPSSVSYTVYDSRGYPVAASPNPRPGNSIPIRTGFGAGEFYVLVSGDGSGERYSFSWVGAVVPEDDDIYETNDTMETAFDLISQEGLPLSQFSEKAIQRNDDWYRIEAGVIDTLLNVTVDFVHADGNIDLFLYDEAGEQLAFSTGFTDTESIAFTLPELEDDEPRPAPLTYYIQVAGMNRGNEYDLVWESVTDLDDDAYEPNDNFDQAYEMPQTNGTLSGLMGLGIENDGADYYVFHLPEGTTSFTAVLNFVDAEGDLDMWAWDSNFSSIQYSGSVSNTETVSFDTFAAERKTIYIQVFTFGTPQGNEYDMSWFFGGVSSFSDLDADQVDDTWELKYGPDYAGFAADGDEDGDAYPVWAEFALRTDPLTADSPELSTYEEGGYLHVRFKRSIAAKEMGYRYIVKEGGSLPPDSPTAVHVETIPGGDYEEVVYRSTVPMSEAPSCFFSVTVEKP